MNRANVYFCVSLTTSLIITTFIYFYNRITSGDKKEYKNQSTQCIYEECSDHDSCDSYLADTSLNVSSTIYSDSNCTKQIVRNSEQFMQHSSSSNKLNYGVFNCGKAETSDKNTIVISDSESTIIISDDESTNIISNGKILDDEVDSESNVVMPDNEGSEMLMPDTPHIHKPFNIHTSTDQWTFASDDFVTSSKGCIRSELTNSVSMEVNTSSIYTSTPSQLVSAPSNLQSSAGSISYTPKSNILDPIMYQSSNQTTDDLSGISLDSTIEEVLDGNDYKIMSHNENSTYHLDGDARRDFLGVKIVVSECRFATDNSSGGYYDSDTQPSIVCTSHLAKNNTELHDNIATTSKNTIEVIENNGFTYNETKTGLIETIENMDNPHGWTNENTAQVNNSKNIQNDNIKNRSYHKRYANLNRTNLHEDAKDLKSGGKVVAAFGHELTRSQSQTSKGDCDLQNTSRSLSDLVKRHITEFSTSPVSGFSKSRMSLLNKDTMMEAMCVASQNPAEIDQQSCDILIRMLSSSDDDSRGKILSLLCRCSSFCQTHMLLHKCGIIPYFQKYIARFAETVTDTKFHTDIGSILLIMTNMAQCEAALLDMKGCIPYLCRLLDVTPPSLQTSILRLLTNLSLSDRLHADFLQHSKSILAHIDSPDNDVTLNSLRVVVNLSTNAKIVQKLLTCRTPERSNDLLSVSTDADLVMRWLTFLMNCLSTVDTHLLYSVGDHGSSSHQQSLVYWLHNNPGYFKEHLSALMNHSSMDIRQKTAKLRNIYCFNLA